MLKKLKIFSPKKMEKKILAQNAANLKFRNWGDEILTIILHRKKCVTNVFSKVLKIVRIILTPPYIQPAAGVSYLPLVVLGKVELVR
jgi:hypothetical protein